MIMRRSAGSSPSPRASSPKPVARSPPRSRARSVVGDRSSCSSAHMSVACHERATRRSLVRQPTGVDGPPCVRDGSCYTMYDGNVLRQMTYEVGGPSNATPESMSPDQSRSRGHDRDRALPRRPRRVRPPPPLRPGPAPSRHPLRHPSRTNGVRLSSSAIARW